MAFVGRTIDEIREQLLGEWAYQYTRLGKTLLTIPGSDAWMWAGALALTLMAQEREAQVLQDQILPDKASLEFLLRHGSVDGLPRRAATASSLTVSISGTPGGSAAPGGRALTSGAGVRFTVDSLTIPLEGTLDGGGTGTLVIGCTEPGAAGNLPIGTTLTWVAAPAGFNATATVVSVDLPGEDVETKEAYAARILANRQSRPASGNRQDWLGWADAVSGVAAPYVYPTTRVVTGTPVTGVLGAVLVVPLGPLPEDSADPTRIVSTGVCDHIAAYIEGTETADGTAVVLAEQVQLRPVTMPAGSYQILPATLSSVDVSMALTVGAVNAFPFDPPGGDYAIQAAPAPTTTTFTILPTPDSLPAAEQLLVGKPVAIELAGVKGGYFLTTTTDVNGATGVVTVSPALPSAPVAGAAILPATPLWAAILAGQAAVFDALGPGDTSPASRWPPPEVSGRPTLYVSQIQAATLGVSGVVNAAVSLPVGDMVPAALELHMLGVLTLRKA